QAGPSRLPRSQVPRHPQHRRRRRARGDAPRRLHAQRSRLGGLAMMRAAAEAATKAARDFAVPRPLCLGVTVLTSLDRAALEREAGVTASVPAHVLRLAERAREAGLDGCVASPQEIRMLRVALGERWVIVTPGIRTGPAE